VYDVANDFAVVTKKLINPPLREAARGIAEVRTLPNNILTMWANNGATQLFYYKLSDAQDEGPCARAAIRVKRMLLLPPLEAKRAEEELFRVVTSDTMGDLCLCVGTRGQDGEVSVLHKKLVCHERKRAVEAASCGDGQFLSWSGDKTAAMWSRNGELLWKLTFGYDPEKLISRLGPDGRLAILFVQMDGGNSALFKNQETLVDDFPANQLLRKQDILEQEQQEAAEKAAREQKEAEKAAEEKAAKDSAEELDRLLAELNAIGQQPQPQPVEEVDEELARLLAELNAVPEQPKPEPEPQEDMDPELLALLKELGAM
jgi:hypothetical protein